MHEENRDPLENPAQMDNNPPAPQDADLSCDEYMVFAMRDNHHSFSLGLETVLKCLQAAEQEGAVPTLPDNWWLAIGSRYDL